MFTGIVQGTGQITGIDEQPGLRSLELTLDSRLLEQLTIGASVALDGVCLTVTGFSSSTIRFDVMQQTLMTTTLGTWLPGQRVNVERSVRYGDEVGGHVVSGHIDAAAEIVALDTPQNNCEIHYRVDRSLLPYILPKGFIALNGCSLTVAEVDREASTFKVCLIPETLRVTTHGDKRVGDRVNIELDRQTQAIVNTVRAFLQDNRADVQAWLE
jgi:riboflavin synthase